MIFIIIVVVNIIITIPVSMKWYLIVGFFFALS